MLKIALKHWVILLLAAVISSGVAFGYFNYMVEPSFTARGAVAVTNGTIINQNGENGVDGDEIVDEKKLSNSDLVVSINFLDTVVDFLKDPGIYKRFAEATGNKYTFSELMAKTKITKRSNNSLFVDVSFTGDNQNETITMVNEFIKLIPDFIEEQVPNTSVYYSLAFSSSPQRLSNSSLILVSGVAGAVVVYLVLFLIYSADNIIRDEESFRDHLNINVIGVVPDFASSKTAEKKYRKYNKYYYGYGGNKNAK